MYTPFRFCRALLLTLATLSPSLAAAETINANKLVQETQQQRVEGDHQQFIWWMPSEFFVVSMQQQPGIDARMIDEIRSKMAPYTIVAVGDFRIGPLGIMDARGQSEVRADLQLVTASGEVLPVLADTEIDNTVKNFLMAMKPGIAAVTGQFGEALQLMVLPARDAQGRPLYDVRQRGALTLRYQTRDFRFRLPLASLLPEKRDPETGDHFPGDYLFNPYTGKALGELQ